MATAGFTTAVINWYSSLRRSLQTVHDDVTAVKSYKVDVGKMDETLKTYQREIMD